MELLISGVLFIFIGGFICFCALHDAEQSGWTFNLFELGMLILGLVFVAWGFYIIPGIKQVV